MILGPFGTSDPKALNPLNAASPGRILLLSLNCECGLCARSRSPHEDGAGKLLRPVAGEAALQQLRKRVEGLSRTPFIVIYCGCCPWSHCPNVRPAYEALHNLGFRILKVLYIAGNLGTDWVHKGYPFEKGE
jgi:hypothetical protein